MADETEPQPQPTGVPCLPLPMQESFVSVRGTDSQVYLLHRIETPLGVFTFLRERDYHLEVMSNGRKAAGAGSIQIAPAGAVPGV